MISTLSTLVTGIRWPGTFTYQLKLTKRYDRVSGYFSVGSFVVVSTGLAGLIGNEGRVRLIVGLHDLGPDLREAYISARARPCSSLRASFSSSVTPIKPRNRLPVQKNPSGKGEEKRGYDLCAVRYVQQSPDEPVA